MQKRGKAVLFIVLCGLIAALFFVALPGEHDPAVKQITAAERGRLEGKSIAAAGLIKSADRLLINGEAVPYSKEENAYYVSCSLQTASLPELFWSNGKQAAYLQIDENFDLASAQKSGKSVPLLIVEGEKHQCASVVFTGLPTVVIDMESDSETFGPYSKAIADVTVFDPDGENGYTVTAAQAKLSYRGASSRFFAKKSYNLKLYDQNGEDSGYPLLGMRQDNEWILKSLFTDPNRIRERLALHLWNELSEGQKNNIPSAEMRYCEVFLDGEYLGLYGLMTPIDPKDYGFDGEKDILYKAASFDILTEDASAYPKKELNENGIKFPTVWRPNLWDGMLWYVNYFYKENPSESFQAMTEHLDLDNFIDYALFHSFVSARDNNFSNTFYLTRYDEEGDYDVLKFPWDMDMTFGNKWSGGWPDMTEFYEETIGEVSFPHDMNVLLEHYEDEMVPLIQKRYAALRKTVFHEAHVLSEAEAYMRELVESGAMAREQARWADMTVIGNIDQIARHVNGHVACLDARIANGSALYDD